MYYSCVLGPIYMVSSTLDNSTPSHAPPRQLIRNLTSVNLLTSDGQARLHTQQNGGRQGVYKEMHARIGKKPARTEQFFFQKTISMGPLAE